MKNINVYYGKLQVLWDMSFKVEEGEIVSLVGSNGSGKTTTLRTISGLLHPPTGTIEFLGERIDRLPSQKIVAKGVAHVPEGRGIFSHLTVTENLKIGAYTSNAWKKKEETVKFVHELFPILEERKNQIAGTLSGGEGQMLAIARALMSKPKLLMLDEPSLGLAPKIVMQIFDLLKKVSKEGITILLVEQNVWQALELANRSYVLETGRVTLEGTGKELLENDQVKKAYLGL